MWREYTRETPGRPGLTLFTAAMALGLTTGLAYFVTHSRAASSLLRPRVGMVEHDVDLPRGWPIRFDLPHGYRFAGSADAWQNDYADDGAAGSVVYYRIDPRNGLPLAETGVHVITLAVRFQWLENPPRLSALFEQKTGLASVSAEPVALGPFNGLMGIGTVQPAGRRYVAVASDACGLVVWLEMELAEEDPRDLADFEAVCESITFQDWFVRVPRSVEEP